MQEWGWTNPVLVDEDGMIIAGHGRILAAQLLGLAEAPVMTARGWSPEQKQAYVLADNQLALNAGWDMGRLAVELSDLRGAGFDLALMGFSAEELIKISGGKGGLTDPDDVPEPEAVAASQLGDVWLLGDHRLVCGDCTDPAAVTACLGQEKPDLMLTDPPYGIGYEYKSHKDKASENADLVGRAFALAPEAKAWTPGLMNLARDIERFGKSRVLVWHKGFAAAGNALGGASTWEPVLVIGPRRKKLPDDHLHFGTERLTVEGKNLRELHSCPKPTSLFRHLINAFLETGEIAYDPFLGSGTTLISAEAEGRRCFGIEIDPIYVDLIVKRWQAFTGKTATLQPTGQTFEEISNARAQAKADPSETDHRESRTPSSNA